MSDLVNREYTVKITRTAEEDTTDTASGSDQLRRELQAACDAGLLCGMFEVERPTQQAAQTCLLPGDKIGDAFARMRKVAADSLALLRLIGIPSNAKIVQTWRELSEADGNAQLLNKGIEDQIARLNELNAAFAQVLDALYSAEGVRDDLESALDRAAKAAQQK